MTFDYKYLIRALIQHKTTKALFRWRSLRIYTRVIKEPWRTMTQLMFYRRYEGEKELMEHVCNESETRCELYINYHTMLQLYRTGYVREMKILLDAMTEYFNNELKIPMRYILREIDIDKSPIMIGEKWFAPSDIKVEAYYRYEDDKLLRIYVSGREYIPTETDEDLKRILEEYFKAYLEYENVKISLMRMMKTGYEDEIIRNNFYEVWWTVTLYRKIDSAYNVSIDLTDNTSEERYIILGVYPDIDTGRKIDEIKRKYSLATRIIRDVITARIKEVMAELELLGQQVVTQ
jgi:Fe-S oxidoreductase